MLSVNGLADHTQLVDGAGKLVSFNAVDGRVAVIPEPAILVVILGVAGHQACDSIDDFRSKARRRLTGFLPEQECFIRGDEPKLSARKNAEKSGGGSEGLAIRIPRALH